MYEKERKHLAKICRLLYKRQLVLAADGNISMRISDEHLIITPSRRNKGMLKAKDIVVTNYNGEVIGGKGKASSEFLIHKAIYENRDDINAIVHTHPVFATAFAITGDNIPKDYLVEASLVLGPVAVAEYGTPGTMEMVDGIMPHIGKVDCMLLKNHGALTYGPDLIDAYNKMEILEGVSKTVIASKILGKPDTISEENLKKLDEF